MTTIIDNNINTKDTEHIILNVYEPLLNIIEIFGQKDKIDSLIKDKLKYNLDNQSLQIINNILNLLIKNKESDSPIRILLNDIQDILNDGKIDSYDIPTLIKIITDLFNLNKNLFKNINIRFFDITIIIKLIISILLDLNIINNNLSYDQTMRIIDSSLKLLETTLNLKGLSPFKNKSVKLCCC
jgi:hypothetical protein